MTSPYLERPLRTLEEFNRGAKPMTSAIKTVREFSSAGPCLTLGQFVRRTPKMIVYREWLYGDNYGDEKRVGGWKVQNRDGQRSYIHTEPCPSCRDHENTQYPNGYMD